MMYTAPALTPASVQALGYTPIPTMPQNPRAIAPAWYEGCGIAVQAGRQANGFYLLALDLDSHSDGQNADATLAHLRAALPRLAPRLAIRRSQSGTGYHLLLLLPFDPGTTAKLYRTDTRQHVGERISSGLKISLDGPWEQGDVATIPLFNYADWQKLCGVLACPETAGPTMGTPRAQRMAEGLPLIQGWQTVRDWQTLVNAACDRDATLNGYRARLRTAPDRSAAYGNFVQSLMLRAGWLAGKTVAERCKVVAAMAIGTGAGGKEADKTYQIERDTAVLIARILHGDRMQGIPGEPPRYWLVPGWANGQQLPAPTVPAAASARPVGRPAGDRTQQYTKLLRVIERTVPDDFGRRFLSVATMASALKVQPRTVQSYLRDLRRGDAPAIKTGQENGNGALYIVLLKCSFGGADNSAKPCKSASERNAFGGANETAILPVPMPERAESDRQCKEEHQKECGPAPAAAGRSLFGVPSGERVAPATEPQPTPRHAVAAAFDRIAGVDVANPATGEVKAQRVTRKRIERDLADHTPALRLAPAALDRLLQIVRDERQRQGKLAALAGLTLAGLKAQLRLAEHLVDKSRAAETNEYRWWEFYRAAIRAEMKTRPVEQASTKRRRGIVEAVPSPRSVALAEQRDMLDLIDTRPQPKAAPTPRAVKLEQPREQSELDFTQRNRVTARLQARKAVMDSAVLHL